MDGESGGWNELRNWKKHGVVDGEVRVTGSYQ